MYLLYIFVVLGFTGPNCLISNMTTEQPMTTEATTMGPMNETCEPADSCEDGHFDCVVIDGFIRRQCLENWSGPDCKIKNFPGSGVDPECPLFPNSLDNRIQCRNDGTCFNGTCCCPPGFVATRARTCTSSHALI